MSGPSTETPSMAAGDVLVYTHRLRRRVLVWRVLAILALVIGVIGILQSADALPGQPHIARLTISGIIFHKRARLEAIDEIAGDETAKALIVRINSPGGTTAGSEALYLALRRVAEKKPVVAIMEDVAASGGYIAALGADHIIAHGNTITGSIGVLFQWIEATELLDNVGITPTIVRSGPLKARTNPYEKVDEEVLKATQAVVDESFAWFVALVAKRRGMEEDIVRPLADGRIFTGRQAKGHKLIDALGGHDEARIFLTTRQIDNALRVRDRDPREEGYARLFFGSALRQAFTEIVATIGEDMQTDTAGGQAFEPLAAGGVEMAVMTRAQLVDTLFKDNPHLRRADVERVVGIILESIGEGLASGARVELRGFGILDTNYRAPHKARNPRTGASVRVAGRRRISFKTAKTLHRALQPRER